MDGKLNCSMSAENAAFTKIRHLENRVTETEIKLDNVEQQINELNDSLQDALTNIQEKVETENVDTTTLNADTIDAVNVISDNVNTLDMTATTIEAETINVDNLENVNVLHGKTVDVEKTIATIGQFTETQTITANNTTTNTLELNVDGETNLIGQINIDGNVTFTKDNGLSKLQGNYLEIDAANIVIDNKNNAEYALYVPGVDGDALFGGSVAVQDTLAAKNLIVTNETYISNLTLNEDTVLENPTFENIAETQELTDKALDIDENGKLIRKFVGGGSAGTIANALIANETKYSYDLLDKYKREDDYVFNIILSNTASLAFNANGTSNAYLENSNGQRYEFEGGGYVGMTLQYFSLAHNNIFYAIIPTFDADMENILGAELRKINLNNMSLEYSIDVSEYFVGPMEDLTTLLSWIPSMSGNVLSEDKPVLPIANTNKYINLANGDILTRDQNFISGYTYYLSKTDTWYELPGNLVWATNNKYASIEDAALIDTPYLENDSWIFDAPLFEYGDNELTWINAGVSNELLLNDKDIFYRDENDNKFFITPGSLIFNDVEYETNLYNNIGYVVNEYVSNTPYQVEKVKIDRTQADFTDVPITADIITINDKATIEDIETSTIDAEVVKTIDAEIDGMVFYEGEWYHKRMSTKTELLEFIKNNTEDKNFRILFDGYLDFNDEDFPTPIENNTIVGTYQIYKKNVNDSVSLTFDGNSLSSANNLLRKVEFYSFNARIDYSDKFYLYGLHLNNCTLDIPNQQGIIIEGSNIECYNMNNVVISTAEYSNSLNINIHDSTNVDISDIYQPNGPAENIRVDIYNSDRCYVAAKAANMKFNQNGAGGNVVLNSTTGTLTQVQPTWI